MTWASAISWSAAPLTGLTRRLRLVRLSRPAGHGPTQPDAQASAEREVSAALKEDLDRLERARMPIQQEGLRMIRGILRMDTVRVREIMRPRVDIVAASVDSSIGELIAVMSSNAHSQVPVFDGAMDNIVGVVRAKDVLAAWNNGHGPAPSVRDLARPPAFVPEAQNLEKLLREFRQRRTGMAIVVDEYGGVSGLVTVTDLIEEIVGKMLDDFDSREPEVRRVSATEVIVDGALPIDELNDSLGLSIRANGFDTVGGLVYRELGTVPKVGDAVTADGFTMKVESTLGRRVRQVRVAKRPVLSAAGHIAEGI